MCHVWQTSVRFSLEEPTETSGGGAWTEEQSRRNYEVVTQLVNASDPESSRLLLKPLAQVAGGLVHTGGNHWDSTQDPEYQAVLEWIRLLPAAEFTPAEEQVAVDFQFYRACVHPQVLSVGRYGQLPCTSCHAGGSAGFAPVGASGGALTVAEARQGIRGAPETDRAWRSRSESLPAEASAPGGWWFVCPQRREAVAKPE